MSANFRHPFIFEDSIQLEIHIFCDNFLYRAVFMYGVGLATTKLKSKYIMSNTKINFRL